MSSEALAACAARDAQINWSDVVDAWKQTHRTELERHMTPPEMTWVPATEENLRQGVVKVGAGLLASGVSIPMVSILGVTGGVAAVPLQVIATFTVLFMVVMITWGCLQLLAAPLMRHRVLPADEPELTPPPQVRYQVHSALGPTGHVVVTVHRDAPPEDTWTLGYSHEVARVELEGDLGAAELTEAVSEIRAQFADLEARALAARDAALGDLPATADALQRAVMVARERRQLNAGLVDQLNAGD